MAVTRFKMGMGIYWIYSLPRRTKWCSYIAQLAHILHKSSVITMRRECHSTQSCEIKAKIYIWWLKPTLITNTQKISKPVTVVNFNPKSVCNNTKCSNLPNTGLAPGEAYECSIEALVKIYWQKLNTLCTGFLLVYNSLGQWIAVLGSSTTYLNWD